MTLCPHIASSSRIERKTVDLVFCKVGVGDINICNQDGDPRKHNLRNKHNSRNKHNVASRHFALLAHQVEAGRAIVPFYWSTLGDIG